MTDALSHARAVVAESARHESRNSNAAKDERALGVRCLRALADPATVEGLATEVAVQLGYPRASALPQKIALAAINQILALAGRE